MNLHEYQAKQLFGEYDLPVSRGFAVDSGDEAAEATKKLGGGKWVVKAQVHAGGRGKAGGVKLVDTAAEAKAFADKWLGEKLVTYQTDANGQPVSKILVEECVDIDQELYLGAVLDRATRRIVFMASVEGGVEIEKVAAESPEKILKIAIDPLTGPLSFQGRELGYKLGLSGEQIKQFTGLFLGLSRLFLDLDLALLEINPLVITKQGNLNCLDGKINADGNALFRQPKLRSMQDPSQEDERESRAAKWDLNYVALDGNIGCMVNGAGLAMGTMDIIQLHGGSPANFLDVGGGATKERVAKAFSIILQDPNVKVILVNIFGGIMKCDIIAEGVVAAAKELSIQVPLVVRLEGTNVNLGKEILNKSGLAIISADNLEDAAQKAVGALG